MPSRFARSALVISVALLASLTAASGSARPEAAGPPTAIAVESDDPGWGSPLAPVTLVHFYDLQCPFSARMQQTLEDLQKAYGPEQLRIVYKHFPLPMHPKARPAAEAAAAVFRVAGLRAFERFRAAAFGSLRGDAGYEPALRAARQSPQRIARLIEGGGPSRKVDGDIALGQWLGVRGTPQSFVNGVKMAGAQPLADFRKIIDEQLQEASERRRRGVPAAEVSRQLTRDNLKRAPQAAPPAPAPPTGAAAGARGAAAPGAQGASEPEPVWKVPIAGSPIRGPRTALVTLVVFSDFQCPFCGRLVPTLDALEKKYGSQLRFVFRHNPLPFHPRAEPAAELSMEAFARKGHAGFWQAHDALFEAQPSLEDADLERIATALGLDPRRTMRAIEQRRHRKRIEADRAWADELEARGTPTTFVNGRKLVGAQPLAEFERVVDEELAKARKLIRRGVPRTQIYAHVQRNAQTGPPPPKKSVPPPAGAVPSRGPAGAPVTVQVFADFECPYSARVQQTLEDLERHYGAKIRILWRHLPLSSHPHARSAAIVAAEAFRQGGRHAFWKMAGHLFQHQADLERADLLSYAAERGLEVDAVERALATDRHGSAIDRDLAAAQQAGITGTPAFVVNGYYIAGAQPLAKFQRVVDRALREARGGR